MVKSEGQRLPRAVGGCAEVHVLVDVGRPYPLGEVVESEVHSVEDRFLVSVIGDSAEYAPDVDREFF
ncbi:hypothetical protein [Catellatospora chokoriensis]|uniref:hypothetical protein n=1 Tax=Catellatospora chokoriensis TaxID=310353 RepID=UPI001786B69F|nr:hypothetical protein [Catellatospora chokoriensis]